jgi:CheY-like chemotaxis protein
VSAVTKVLVVDDDDVNRIYLETILKRLGKKQFRQSTERMPSGNMPKILTLPLFLWI